MISPDYPHIVLSFIYRGVRIEVERGELDGKSTYAVWVDYDTGCAMAVPYAHSKIEAIKKAKKWVDKRFGF